MERKFGLTKSVGGKFECEILMRFLNMFVYVWVERDDINRGHYAVSKFLFCGVSIASPAVGK